MDKPSSSRAPPPPPLNLASLPTDKFNLNRRKTDDSEASSLPASTKRSASYSSTASTSSTTFSLRKTQTGLIKSSPTVNVHTTCGRHTDQFFFRGPSLMDLARSIRRKI
ncbi:hypothetical protein VFPPC_13317 [Pochonia chlamydosporia 170]|uniref:Uncharacterized protein n=1 Tax=Pochonia chlamydosporia 170 TaxID=1380566 RepID=A0A179FYI8_METCM|nr:hypothetical protein VFPPC_13317 [Pochonia chlamydosporia 170]OAQ70181.1 hypothetical protein VFPPC_13317 [Pochonia chlamydosporia 170]